MAVIINEVEHTAMDERRPDAPLPAPRAGSVHQSPEALREHVVSAVRREAARLARLWTD